MLYRMFSSRVPPHCERTQAAGLSVPTDSFRMCTNYPDLNTDQFDSLRYLRLESAWSRLSQDVLDVLPTDTVLDPYGTGPHTGLDTANLHSIVHSMVYSAHVECAQLNTFG